MTRNTHQKQIVLETVTRLGTHPTADAVYAHVKAAIPSISRATVFRILNQFAQEGKLQKIRNPDAADNFDHRLDHHYHVLCTQCGHVDDVDCPVQDELYRRVRSCADYTLTGHDVLFYGLCPTCRAPE